MELLQSFAYARKKIGWLQLDSKVSSTAKKTVDKKLSDLGAIVVKDEKLTPYSYRYEIKYDKDLMEFSKAKQAKSVVSISKVKKHPFWMVKKNKIENISKIFF